MTTWVSKKYYRNLLGTICHCRRHKQSRRSFCYDCYKRLPKHQQQNLYKILDFGYQEAYDAAVRFLERNPI